MQVETIPAVYGRALLGAAEDKGIMTEVAEEVEVLRTVLEGDADLRGFIESPRLESSKKREILEKALRGKASDVLTNFTLLLVDKGRESSLGDILAAFGKLHDDHIGLVRAEAVSAVPLEGQTMVNLELAMGQKLGKKVVLENKVDPDILGGLIVRFDGMVADGSVQKALGEIKGKMLSLKFGSELVHED